ncbi:PDR/VanB family oxidoreductase [Peribacillus alkalitolerans]|uniref:PDR/VanB family oxidoreductase n=1 Tax=Peribacillus alkalitolerans TaxID=1550385 RepID=UPI0013CFD4DA|nr:PDR/VanB family oxidoreductase [Peribacillus alkalitolerans]
MYKETKIRVKVKSIYKENQFVKRFTLVPVDRNTLPSFTGGAHITTYIDGKQRSYSLTSPPDQTNCYQLAIRLSEQSKGGSVYWHQHMKEGDELSISYPKNHFPLSFQAKHHVFYAAGIGITPFLSMMSEIKGRGESFELHYTAKTRDLCAFYHFLNEEYPGQCRYYFTQEEGSERLKATTLLQHPIGTHVYFCGKESFITKFSEAARNIGYPSSSIHVERFTPSLPLHHKPFQVKLSNGYIFEVGKDQTLLEALIGVGVKAPYSCRVGRCGTCELKVVEGEIDHFDSFLDEEEKNGQKRILTCVSRAKSNMLVLDIKQG